MMRNVYDLVPEIDTLPTRHRESFGDLTGEEEFWELYELSKAYSMLHVTGFFNLYTAIRYVAAARIPGDVVECGVLFGGSGIFAAKLLERLGETGRTLHLYDTFAGFPPGEVDRMLGQESIGPVYENFREAVDDNLAAAGVKGARLVEGPVERTLVEEPLPERIALLRLDTDFYNSTKAELEHLYPRLSTGGVLIVDDYGYFEGSRRACDEFFGERMMWSRIDGGVRSAVKVERPRGLLDRLLGR